MKTRSLIVWGQFRTLLCRRLHQERTAFTNPAWQLQMARGAGDWAQSGAEVLLSHHSQDWAGQYTALQLITHSDSNIYLVLWGHESVSQLALAGYLVELREKEREKIIKLIKSQKLNQYLRTEPHETILLIIDLINLLFTLLRMIFGCFQVSGFAILKQ